MTAKQYDRVIEKFLDNPHRRAAFDPFYLLCINHTIGILRYLQRIGWQLPLDQYASTRPLHDMALDILGSFLGSEKDRPFFVVLDYFADRCTRLTVATPPDDIYDRFRALLVTFVKQELGELRRQQDPQRENLKRRLRDILNGPDFTRPPVDGSEADLICSQPALCQLRVDKPMLTFEELLHLAGDAYAQCSNREQWCRVIFARLASMPEVANCLRRHELIRAMVTVNLQCVETGEWLAKSSGTAKPAIARRDLESARNQALEHVRIRVLERFVLSGSVTEVEAGQFLKAAATYLVDLAYSPGVDKLPAYFREVMAPETHGGYLERYKYPFETTMKEAEEYFRARLKEISQTGRLVSTWRVE